MTGFSSIPLAEEGGSRDGAHLAGVAKILGPRWAQLPAITLGLLGVQVFWSVEMSYATPYLLSLGLTKAAVSLVFLAGPISGLVVQPLIGVMADNSKSRFGRRRPYMVVGCLICTTAMLLLGFTRPVASIFLPAPSSANDGLTIWLAILALFVIDFSINAVQAVDRALIVDTLPAAEQADATAWAARMLGIGSVAGYFIGNIDMTAVFPFLGDTELEVLAVVGSLLLLSTHLVTATFTKEKVVVATKGAKKKSFTKELRDIWDNARTLPPVIRQICMIQLFSWMGWFPVLFYTSAFVGDLHKRASPLAPENPTLDAEATRLGTRALFYSALLSLASNILLPFFVAESARSRRALGRAIGRGGGSVWVRAFERVKVGLPAMWAAGHLVFAGCMFATFFYSSVAGATFFTALTGFSWSITQWAPFSLLAEAILTEDGPEHDAGSIVLEDTRTRRRSGDFVALADDYERQFLVGSDVEDEDDDRRVRTPRVEDDVQSFSSDAEMDDPVHESGSGAALRSRSTSAERDRERDLLRNLSARTSHLDVHSLAQDEDEDGTTKPRGGLAAKAGIIIGIHNIFVVIPQFIMTGVASLIFLLLDPSKAAINVEDVAEPLSDAGTRAEDIDRNAGPNSYAVIYRIGGLSVAVAFVLTLRLARELRRH
ncbi:MFS general substrate transporter [Lenzites betulinus]|nr:MFS general substrate transporter [Lenzites betulinus]